MPKNNINMTTAMSAEYGQDIRKHASSSGGNEDKKIEDVTESGWYDKINNFQPENEDIPVEIIQEIEEEDASSKIKIEALIKIIGRKNRDGLKREESFAKETIKNESLSLYTNTQEERIVRLEEEKEQQKKDYVEIKKSMEDFKRQLATKDKFLQTVESSNRRLSEDLTEKINTLGTTGKDKKSLTKLANAQKKEIASMVEAVDHLKKEVATKGRLVEKYERERREWVKELVEKRGPFFQENKELTARVEFLEGELDSALQSVRESGMESLKTFQSTRSPTPAEETSILADEMKGGESGEEEGMWKGEKVEKIDFQPPGRDRLSAMATIGDMAKERPNPDRPASLHQPSSPSFSTFWSEGVATENGFSIPKALSSVSADEKAKVVTGRLDAGVQTEAAGPAVSSSAQTVSLEVREASVQTEDWKSGPSEDGMKAVASGGEWQPWWVVVIMILACAMFFYFGRMRERWFWYGANRVSQGTFTDFRDHTHGMVPWVEKLKYNLHVWQKPDGGFLG